MRLVVITHLITTQRKTEFVLDKMVSNFEKLEIRIEDFKQIRLARATAVAQIASARLLSMNPDGTMKPYGGKILSLIHI